jgi:hypothetical protein
LASWTVQLITLLGVALGALASFVSTRLVDRSRWQREERLHWDTKRLDCYSDFSAAIMRYINIGYRMAASLGLSAVVEPLNTDSGIPALATFVITAQRRRDARSRFYAAVRADLGVVTGDIPADLGVRLEQREQSELVKEADGN